MNEPAPDPFEVWLKTENGTYCTEDGPLRAAWDAGASEWRARAEKAEAELESAENRADEEWLEAIGTAWKRTTGSCWETRDGETHEEGVSHNVGALFSAFEERESDLKAELERVQKQAAAMREALEFYANGFRSDPYDDSKPISASKELIADMGGRAKYAVGQGIKGKLDAGLGYIHRDKVKPLLEALEKIQGSWGDADQPWHSRVAKRALADAKAKGIL